MSWMSELSKVYDSEAEIVGKKINNTMLLPVYHSTQKAQIDVFLYNDATFGYAAEVSEDDSVTVIPVSEDSATRSSGIAPHPLCDKLIYLAGDYAVYVKDAKKNTGEFFDAYIEGLANWVDSDYSDSLIKSIYQYLKKGTLIADLIDNGLLKTDDGGQYLDNQYKVAKTAQPECFVRFTVIDKDTGNAERVWECQRLYDKFIAYTAGTSVRKDLCYITGELVPVTYKHSAKIRNSGDKAKLLSSNDSINFTYRGRFADDHEAYAVSSEVSQKAHLALRWLIERQGTSVGTAKYVTWESNLNPILDVTDTDELSLFSNLPDDAILPKTNAEYGKAVSKWIKGYRQQLDNTSKIMLICVDAATPGRLSMVQYQEFSTTDYYDHLEKWYTQTSWHAFWYKDKRRYDGISTPTPYEIVRYAYGTERSDSGKLAVDDKLLPVIYRQIYSCILQGAPMPENILTAIFNRCASPLKYSEKFNNWEHLLDITCALYRKHYIEKEGVEYNVGLDRTCTDRSYLFGRLVAVADKMESDSFERGEVRQTNAKRYMTAMIGSPFKTWTYLEERVLPYTAKIMKQNPQFYAKYEKELEEIHALFRMEDYTSRERLDAGFFMGFYCQKQEFYKKITDITEES